MKKKLQLLYVLGSYWACYPSKCKNIYSNDLLSFQEVTYVISLNSVGSVPHVVTGHDFIYPCYGRSTRAALASRVSSC